jgi:hypothetical protein
MDGGLVLAGLGMSNTKVRGVYVNGGNVTTTTKFTINSGEIYGHSADYGGGVYVSNYHGAFTINSGKIYDNIATTFGGGVYINYGPFIMDGGEIYGNLGESSGGGVFSRGTFTMNSGEIYNNFTGSNGGGGGVSSQGAFTMNGGKIYGNRATNYGGGVHIGGGSNFGTFTMNGGEIYANSSTVGGGGLSVNVNCTFEKNAGPTGGIIYGYDGTDKSNTVEGNGNLVFGMGHAIRITDDHYKDNIVHPTVYLYHDSGTNIGL